MYRKLEDAALQAWLSLLACGLAQLSSPVTILFCFVLPLNIGSDKGYDQGHLITLTAKYRLFEYIPRYAISHVLQ
jgi:hypothetical protein